MSDPKARSRKKTVDQIQQAIARVQAGPGKVSISGVAKLAGVTPSLIHNTYPDLAEKIRGLMGKASRTQRNAKHDALVRERDVNRALRQELVEARTDLAKLASVNQMLLHEVALLRGAATGKVVSIIRTK
ncbi:MAG: TetR family transcriptional regulator [Hydrogenophaga sp.]|jgi:AcrR family transcriptional regulator|uniref:TetR family transcriptional regulator n=1 Tax=Hydrogenophaga sp. TaxID=1904254 RepID=UPI0025BC5D80|nr:TetR family transcriptional regulator [Hydrogenophaga sp.]MCG2655776.1 TetR family transcriptional regulator [Hydrogenophaga sp.]MDP1657025.1 TetR family transcriptional regulator [Hylemonella sp.]